MNKTSVAFKEELIDLFPSVRLHITKFPQFYTNLVQFAAIDFNSRTVFINEAWGFTVYI